MFLKKLKRRFYRKNIVKCLQTLNKKRDLLLVVLAKSNSATNVFFFKIFIDVFKHFMCFSLINLFGVAVARFIRSTKLLYAGPG